MLLALVAPSPLLQMGSFGEVRDLGGNLSCGSRSLASLLPRLQFRSQGPSSVHKAWGTFLPQSPDFGFCPPKFWTPKGRMRNAGPCKSLAAVPRAEEASVNWSVTAWGPDTQVCSCHLGVLPSLLSVSSTGRPSPTLHSPGPAALLLHSVCQGGF